MWIVHKTKDGDTLDTIVKQYASRTRTPFCNMPKTNPVPPS